MSETRKVLAAAEISGPYVLCPHSISGIEAIYWAQQYPNEIKAIVGLDMAVPASYKEMKENLSFYKILSFAVDAGVLRIFPSMAESEAIDYGTLSAEEKELYSVITNRRTLTKAMMNEASTIQESAERVANGKTIDKPMLMFISDGSGGAGYDETAWRGFEKDFAAKNPNAAVIELDCPHYVHDHEYKRIAEEMKEFLLNVE